MGVDYYSCDVCNESHYEEYVASCSTCWNRLCTGCLVNKDVEYQGNPSRYAHHYGLKFDSTDEALVKEWLAEGYVTVDKDGNYDMKDGEVLQESAIADKYCPFCQGNIIDDGEILSYLLKKYNLTLESVWEEIKKNK